MESSKFLLMAAVLAFLVLVPSRACSRWVKLNTSPVCFGARDNKFGSFKYNKNIFVKSFMLVHRSGSVSCNNKDHSYWGCWPNHVNINTVITDGSNRVLGPSAAAKSPGWYQLPGFTSSSSALVFCGLRKPAVCVHSSEDLRLWYAEDLYGYTEADNAGRSCADVYAEII